MGRRLPVLLLLALFAVIALPCAAEAAITGTVYMDYNSNGANNTGGFVSGSSAAATDVGVGSVTVNAYDATGTRVSTTTTATNGTYTICSSGCSGTVRLEFSVPTGYQPSFKGTNNGTSVRFVNATTSGVDFAVTKATEYCQDNPRLVTCEFPYLTGHESAFGVFSVASGFGESPDKVTVDNLGDIPDLGGSGDNIAQGSLVSPSTGFGATWGIGIDRGQNAFLGTYVKRHSNYGPSGAVNEIYRVNLRTGAASPFIRLGVGTLPAHDLRIAPGVAPTPDWPALAVDGLRTDGNASDVYHLVGRAGLGDVDVSPDGSTLWSIEMTEAAPKLWQVPLTGIGDSVVAGTPVSYTLPLTPAVANGVSCEGKFHPMGMAVTDSRLLVGGVCGGETRSTLTVTNRALTSNVATITTSTPHGLTVGERVSLAGVGSAFNNSGTYWIVRSTPTPTTFTFAKTNANITSVASSGTVTRATGTSAFVLEFDLAAHTFSTIAATTLNYPKGGTNLLWQSYEAVTGSYQTGAWHDWVDTAPVLPSLTADRSWPEPLLANIEIRPDGGLVLAFRDRYMDQASPNTVDYESASVSSWSLSHAYNGGADMLLLCASGSGYEREFAAACPSTPAITGANASGLLSNSTSNAPQQGTNGTTKAADVRDASSLFFWNGYAQSGAEALYAGPNHPYTSQGGTALLPGTSVLWSTAWDVNSLTQQGIRALGSCPAGGAADTQDLCGPSGAADGALIGGASLVAGKLNDPWCNGADCWGKGNGLSDLEVLCDAAPVQIGNYVWIDANRNGIQDPGEAVVPGVTVHLYDATNALVGTAVTDANGQYYFASNVSEPAAGTGDNAGGGLTTGQAFTVRVDNPADYAVGGPLVPYTLTSATQTSAGAGSSSTSVDSNAAIVTGYPEISVAALSAGQNNHTYDVGFVTPLAATPVAVGNYTWIDANSNGVQDGGESPLAGVVVALLNPDGSPANDINGSPVTTQTTDAQGRYLFDNLAPGTYKIQFTLPSGYTFTTTGGGTAANDSNPSPGVNPLVGTTPVFAVSAIVTGDTVADTDPGTLATRVNPTIDAGVVSISSGGGSSGGGGSSSGGSGGGGSGGGGGSSGGSNANAGADASSSSGGAGSSSTTRIPDLTGQGKNGANSNGVNGGPGSTNPVPGANSGALVGVGDLVWFDTNSNGVQDSGELPMRGATVVILNANGTRARDANGKVIPAQTTDAQGHYFFANLQPGRYQMKFIYPQSYVATVPGKGAKAKGSNAKATAKRNVAITPTFVVAGTSYGETAKATGNRKAVYANPSIDAGVVPPWAQRVMGPESVTG